MSQTATRRALSILLAITTCATPGFAGGIAVLETELADNGDGDGFADTRETVSLRLKVRNTTGADLTGVTLHLKTNDASLICISDAVLVVGDLLAGQELQTTDAFEFVVADVDRSSLSLGPFDDLSAGFELTVTAQPADPQVYAWRMRFDLDLDVTGGAGDTSYFESFEDGLGTFEGVNLDAGTGDLASSEGLRCQYHNPDWINSAVYGTGEVSKCYVASPLHADAFFWGLSGPETSPLLGRGFSGLHSLFYGIDLGPPQNWTTPVGTLEAVATSEPIYLGWDGVAPALSIKHQTSLLDERIIGQVEGTGEALDRGVVMVQVADDLDAPAGDWLKLDPYQNVYDQIGTDNFFNCMFDPDDDGHDEDSFFDPADPERVYGPSSTCFPEYAFADIGHATEPFDPGNVGRADGPALDGGWGIGTWIESKFDLGRFRGRKIRLRFLTTALQAVPHQTWEDYFQSTIIPDNPITGDDGWWIDDVTVVGTLTSAAAVAVDVTDNSALPGPRAAADPDEDFVCLGADNCPFVSNPDQLDGDFDGAGAVCDCDDADATVFPGAAEVNDGQDNGCSGDAGYGAVDELDGPVVFADPSNKNVLSWLGQPGAARHQVVRAASPDFLDVCTLFPPSPATAHTDAAPVAPGAVHYYLVRPFLPNLGSWGLDSAGVERTVPCD
jgi:hypothetical protein